MSYQFYVPTRTLFGAGKLNKLHAQELQAGDVVTIPVGVKHWHKAAKDSWFAHIAIEVSGENTSKE